MEQVKKFCYLGSEITDNRSTEEIKRRIALAKQAFQKMKELLTSKHIKIVNKESVCKNIYLEHIIVWQ